MWCLSSCQMQTFNQPALSSGHSTIQLSYSVDISIKDQIIADHSYLLLQHSTIRSSMALIALQDAAYVLVPPSLYLLVPPSRTRSSDHLCLSLRPVSTRLKFADRSFRNSSPRFWNSLPINLRSSLRTHTTVLHSSALLLPTFAEHSLFIVISFFRALQSTSSLFPTLHNFSAIPCLPAPFPTGQF